MILSVFKLEPETILEILSIVCFFLFCFILSGE